MLIDLNLVNAKALFDGEIADCAISVNEGKIYKIGKLPSLPRASSTIDVGGRLVLPGLIDVHVHLRDMELSYKEDFLSGTEAAALGGFTTVLDMPGTRPLTDSPRRLEEKISRARGLILVNVGFYGAFPSQLKDLDKMVESGAIAFKLHLARPLTKLQVDDDSIVIQALKRSAELGRVVSVHAEDRSIIEGFKKALRRTGDSSIDAYLKAYNPEAEVEALRRIIRLAGEAKAKIHIAHVSTERSLELIARAKREGLKLTCEVIPHHLLLSEKDLFRLGSIAITDPPLRPFSDMLAMWRGLRRGIIDVIASDHAPHSLSEKRERDVWKVPPGIPGLETTLPLILTRFKQGDISLFQVLRLLSRKPAEIFGLKGKGQLGPNFDADLVVVDMKEKFVIDSSDFRSKARYSPFDGCRVVGKAVKTFVRGELVAEDGEIVAKPGCGQICSP